MTEIENSHVVPGFLLIDKPAGITSHDVIDRLRRVTGEKRIGHAGTLDPFATGLLLVGVGREATREMQKLVGLDKTYEATFVLGATSDTDDVTGKISTDPTIPPLGKGRITQEELESALKSFVGEIDQVPPTYAAIKIQGKKLYELARAGKPTLVEPRRVTIYSIELLSLRGATGDEAIFSFGDPYPTGRRASYRQEDTDTKIASVVELPRNDKELSKPSPNNLIIQRLPLRIHCSSGTYIRSIARDLGKKLNMGGYVETLRRTTIGPFSIEKATTLADLTSDNWNQAIIPIQTILTNL